MIFDKYGACRHLSLLDLGGGGQKTTATTANSAATDQAENTQITGNNKSNLATGNAMLLQNSKVALPGSVQLETGARLNVVNKSTGVSESTLLSLTGQFLEASKSNAVPSNSTPTPEPKKEETAAVGWLEKIDWKIVGGVASVVSLLLFIGWKFVKKGKS